MTLEQLKKAIADYTHRDDLADKMDGFIELARTRIGRDARLIELERSAYAPMVNGVSGLPSDYVRARAVISRYAGRNVNLEYLTPIQFADVTGAGGQQLVYTIQNGQIKAGGGIGGVTLQYYTKPFELKNPGDTNLVLDNHPGLYLYGSLIEAFRYLQDKQSLDIAMGAYLDELNQANKQANEARYSGAPMVMR